jgi:hypothetical protein
VEASRRSYISAFTIDPLHLYRPSYIVNPDFLLADVAGAGGGEEQEQET